MFIHELELKGYTRLALNKIEYIHLKFDEIAQIILGKNGSGKSSLVREASPLPALAADYSKDGFKRVHCKHNGSWFELKSMFSPSQKHYFIKDGVNLNPGGTLGIQKELVKQYFNVTFELQQLTLGVERFTAMSPSRRKEMMIALCDTDYTYALQCFAKLKERLRDTQGAIKFAQKRFVAESQKLLVDTQRIELEENISKLESALVRILELKQNPQEDPDALEHYGDRLEHSLIKASEAAIQMLQGVPKFFDLKKAEESKVKCHLRANDYKAILPKLAAQCAASQQVVDLLRVSENQSLEAMREQTAATRHLVSKTLESLIYPQVQPDNALACIEVWTNIYPDLINIWSNMKDNSNATFSYQQLLQARQDAAVQQERHELTSKRLASLQAELDHLNRHRGKVDTVCPNCNHGFSLNFDPLRIQAIEQEITSLTDQQLQLLCKVKELENYIEDCSAYGVSYNALKQAFRAHPDLHAYWLFFEQMQISHKTPALNQVFANVESDLKDHIRIASMQQDCEKLQTLIASITDVGTQDLQTEVAKLEACNLQLQEVTQASIENTAHLNSITQQIWRYKQLIQQRQVVLDLINDLSQNTNARIETDRRISLSQFVRSLSSEFAKKQHILHEAKTQKALVDNIDQQLAMLRADEVALKLCADSLSPTDGLVAKGLLGFMRAFVARMNYFIALIWTYPLEVQPCKFNPEKFDLDYYFPVVVARQDNTISDVSKGSLGIKEIIDIAFKLACLSNLDLSDYPLYLDEFGSCFDDEHRALSMYVVKTLIEQNIHPQIFVVTHYEDVFGAIPNAQICELTLGASKREVPGINAHVRFEAT